MDFANAIGGLLFGERQKNLFQRRLTERIVFDDGQLLFGRVHNAEHSGPFARCIARNVICEQRMESIPGKIEIMK